MCGIAGTLSLGPALEERDTTLVEAMTAALRHRGPDGRRVVNLEKGVLGNARLKITDVATGARVDPEWDSRWRWFAGWRDADTIYVAIPRHFSYSWRPRDRTRIRVAACDLPDGRCTTVSRLRGLSGLVLGPGPEAS